MSIAKKTKEYIVARPAIHHCLRRGIINYSALAREIAQFYRISDLAPIMVAASRYSKRLQRVGSVDKKIDRAIKNSDVTMTTDVYLFAISLPTPQKTTLRLHELQAANECRLVKGNKRALIVCPGRNSAQLRGVLGKLILREHGDLIQISIVQSVEVMKLPGVASRLFGLLGEAGIAIVDSFMIAGEHIMFCDRRDIPRVNELVHQGYLGRG